MNPDLAQKLLTDLRLRKERMATFQNSGRHVTAANVYGNSRQTFKGSMEMMILDMTRNMQKGNTSTQRRTSMTSEASNQIVPYRKGRNSLSMDLPMALALTFNQRSSAANPGIINVEWLSGTKYPTLTRLQINEIAKGVQKLNQVLRTCSSNGLKINGRSIEIGTQLLKGALDLEESLRMLVSLQETTEYMGSSTRTKSRIKLLENGEDGDEDSIISKIDRKNVKPPVFSFDKNPDKRLTKSAKSLHQRTGSCDQVIHKSPAISQQETGKISNIVAKLMGLEDRPSNTSQEIKTGRQAITDGKENQTVSTCGSSKRSEFRIEDDEREMQSSKMTILASNKQQTRREISMLPFYENYDLASNDSKAKWGEVKREEITYSAKDTRQSMHKLQEQKTDSMKRNQKGERRKDTREEMKADSKRQDDQKSKDHDKGKGTMVKDKLQRTELAAKTHNKDDIGSLSRTPGIPDSPKDKGKVMKFHKPEERNQHAEYNRSQAKKAKGIKTEADDSTNVMQKLKKLQSSKPPLTEGRPKNKNSTRKHEVVATQQEDPGKVRKSNIPTTNLVDAKKLKKENDRSEVEEDESRAVEVKSPMHMEVKSAEVPTAKKKPSERDVQKSGIPQKHDEGMNKRSNITYKTDGKPKFQKTIISRLNQKISNKVSPVQREAFQGATLPSPVVNELQNLDEHDIPQIVGNERENTIQSQEHQPPEEGEVKALETPKTIFHPPESIGHESKETINIRKQQKPYKFEVQEPLTEEEVYLKQTLVTSPLFLNTAEALFKLNIPISILSTDDDHIHKEKECKLVLDCSYEILQRKARQQDLTTCPGLNLVVDPVKVKSLDDLVKQLHKDLEVLKCYGMKRKGKDDEADQLSKMLELDVNHSNSDVNSMWDLGWNDKFLANIERDEVAREVTSNILEDLIDEIAKELLDVSN